MGGCLGAGALELNILGGLDDEFDQDESTAFLHHRLNTHDQAKKTLNERRGRVDKT